MKKITIFVAVLIFLHLGLLIHPPTILAAKQRVRSGGGVRVTTGNYSKVSIYPSRLGTIISLFNLDKVSRVSYVLSYTGSGKPQGVVGSFIPSSASDSRELLFGTCSRGACVYHEGVKTARLTINFTLKQGGVYSKRYTLKVKK